MGGGIVVGAILSSFEVTIGRRRIARKRRNRLALRYGQRWRMMALGAKNGQIGEKSPSLAYEYQLLKQSNARVRRRIPPSATPEAAPLIHHGRRYTRKDSNGGFTDFNLNMPRTRALREEIAKKEQVLCQCLKITLQYYLFQPPLAVLCSTRPQPPCHDFRTVSVSVYCPRCRVSQSAKRSRSNTMDLWLRLEFIPIRDRSRDHSPTS